MPRIGSAHWTSLPSIRSRSEALSRETVFEMLKNTRRRYVFHILSQRAEPITLAALSEEVAALEYDTEVEDLNGDQRQRIYVSLRQTHLPRLDEANVVDFDAEANTVALAENASDLQVYLETVPDDDILWAQFYLGLAGVGVGLLLFLWLGVPPLSTYPTLVGTVMLAVLGGSAVVHHRHLQRRRLGTGESPI